MTDLISAPPGRPVTTASQYPHDWIHGVIIAGSPFTLPSGALHIGGDSPDGLVLLGAAPVERTIRLYDQATGELIAETTSDVNGEYAFDNLSTRPNGYAVWIVGDAGERGVIIPGVQPG